MTKQKVKIKIEKSHDHILLFTRMRPMFFVC
jgi:hypothetical protein